MISHDVPNRAPMMRRAIIRSYLGNGHYILSSGGVLMGYFSGAVPLAVGSTVIAHWSGTSGVWVIR